MKLFRGFQIAAIVFIFLTIAALNVQAFEPMPDETIFKISNLSDTFIYGNVQSKTHFVSMEGRPRTLYTIKVVDIIFDKVSMASARNEIEVITNEGFMIGPTGVEEMFKELNTPTLSVNGYYLLFLRWDNIQNAFVLTSGETSVFEVDDQGNMLNFDGVYILDIKEGRPVFGFPKASKTRELMDMEVEQEPLPAAIVTDVDGEITQVIEPSHKWFQEQQAKEIYLTKDQFLEKVREGEK